jgi:monofunctional biosynthetic peptidoglycan transglycosylase
VIALLLAVVLVPIALAAVYRVAAPPLTLLMVERLAQGYGLQKAWRPLSDISPDLVRSVIAAEDAHFCSHHGFDMAAMRAAAAHNARDPRRVRGGSTISQQTAKNVFLWPQRSYVRKGLEAGFTSLIEALWGKRRILRSISTWWSGDRACTAHRPPRSAISATGRKSSAPRKRRGWPPSCPIH